MWALSLDSRKSRVGGLQALLFRPDSVYSQKQEK